MNAWLHRLPMSGKFLLTLTLPLLAVLYLAGTGILERQSIVKDMTQLTKLTTLSQHAGNLTHQLQLERGMTAGFLGSKGKRFGDALNQQRSTTQTALSTYQSTLKALSEMELSPQTVTQLANIKEQTDSLSDIRQQVDAQALPASQAIEYYSSTNSELMTLVGQLTHVTQEVEISRRLSAYYALLEAKELAGIERAVLTNVFAVDRMTPAIMQRYLSLIGQENAFLQSFNVFGNTAMKAKLKSALQGTEIEQLVELRERVLQNVEAQDYGVNPQQWFDWQTLKVERLAAVEHSVVNDVMDTAGALRQQASNALWRYAIIAVVAVGLALLLAFWVVRSIVDSLRSTLRSISERGGDLTQRLTVPGKDELSSLYQAFNESTASTEVLVANIKKSAQAVRLASGEIARGNQDLARRTEEQSASLVETAASMEQITATVRQNADSARQAEALSAEVSQGAHQAKDVAGQAHHAMDQIHDANQQVTAIVKAIDSIAFQTNLLALNASVEAARAGEHGRGFAVVASEVRKLASRSAEEAQSIRSLINNSVAKINEGETLVLKTGDVLQTIADQVQQMADRIAEITLASTEQTAGIEQINLAMNQLEEVTQQNNVLVEQVTQASSGLDERAEDMAETVGQFQVSSRLSDDSAVWQRGLAWQPRTVPTNLVDS